MKTGLFFLLTCCMFFAAQQLAAQSYKPGDQLETLINNQWKKVKLIRPVSGQKNMYEVKEMVTANRGASVSRTVVSGKLRFPRQAAVTATAVSTTAVAENKTGSLHLGRYEIYAGVPSMYIGHMILQENGRYKVAFNTDEDNYDEMGRYVYHPETNTIEWQFGMFKNNNWGGKVVTKESGRIRIEFNPTSYAELK